MGAVIAAETGQPRNGRDRLRLPLDWRAGLTGAPGFDETSGLIRMSDDPDTACLSRAHPLVMRAIRHGMRLPAATAAARHDCSGFMMTYEIEAPVGGPVPPRRMVSVAVLDGAPPAEADPALLAGGEDAPRASRTVPEDQLRAADKLAGEIAARFGEDAVRRWRAVTHERLTRARIWLRLRSDHLCGDLEAAVNDLFGAPPPGPAWRYLTDPRARLVSFATDPAVPAARRREANDLLALYQELTPDDQERSPVLCRPVGMLILVPEDVG